MRELQLVVRQCLGQPGFSAVAIVTLALTIGAASLVFSIFDAVLLRPFPFAEPDRLVRLQTLIEGDKGDWKGVSYYDFDDLRRRQRSLENVAAHATFPNQLTGRGPARAVRMTFASAGFFETLRVAPHAGRVFRAEEDVLGGPVKKVVLSHALWRELFPAPADAIGQTVQLRGDSYEVIGVMPPGFDYPNRSQVWVPLMARCSGYKDEWWKRRDVRPHYVVARLAPGRSLDQARQEWQNIARQLRQEHPEQNRGLGGDVITLRQAEVGPLAPYVRATGVAVGLLLLLGCVNLANLFIARGAAREKEMALRLALGSNWWPLVRQIITEALVYSLAGAALGLLVAYAGVRGFSALLPPEVPSWMALQVDTRVVAFAVVVGTAAALLAAVLPALQQMRTDAGEVLKQGARGSSGGTSFSLLVRRGLIVTEVALSVALLIGAALLARSFDRLMSVDTGVDPSNLLVTRVSRFVPGVAGKTADDAYNVVYRRSQLALAELPGVAMVSGGYAVPFIEQSEQRGSAEIYTMRRTTRDQAVREPFAGADVMPGYFAALGIPLLEGRDFNERDTIGSQPVVVIGKRTAEKLFPGESAVGQRLRWGNNQGYDPWMTVVGVVGDVKFSPAETQRGLEVYWSYRQYPGPGMYLLIRTQGNPNALAARVSNTVRAVAPDVALERVVAMTDALGEHVWRRRLWSVVLSAFAALALVIAMVGLYGVMSFLVAQRSRELGIRLAIGASSVSVLGLVLGSAGRLVVAGAVLGLTLAVVGARGLEGLVFGLSPYDPFTYLLVALVMLTTALAAALVPAWRAARLDPVIVLRED